jgi:hypothetical protein
MTHPLSEQCLLAERAEVADLKLFVPTEFGNRTDRDNPKSVLAFKQCVTS